MGDLNALMLVPERADVERRITDLVAYARELLEPLRTSCPVQADYLARQIGFSTGFYGSTDFWACSDHLVSRRGCEDESAVTASARRSSPRWCSNRRGGSPRRCTRPAGSSRTRRGSPAMTGGCAICLTISGPMAGGVASAATPWCRR
ncbi:hypothetical protein NKG94_48790 [Micromonospora sp. M12]